MATGFNLEIERDFTEYLGIGIEDCEDSSTCHLLQKGLTTKIVETSTKMTDYKPNWTTMTPVALLGSNPKGELFNQKDWNYKSVVGKLLYVLNKIRHYICS